MIGLVNIDIKIFIFVLKWIKRQSYYYERVRCYQLWNHFIQFKVRVTIKVQPLILLEVQSGEYLGEDDIQRFEDNYGRDNLI